MRFAVQGKRTGVGRSLVRYFDIAPIQHVAELIQRFRMLAKRRLLEQLQRPFGILFAQTAVFVDIAQVHRSLGVAEAQAFLVEPPRRLEASLVVGGESIVVQARTDIQRQAAVLLAVARFIVRGFKIA